MTDTIRGEGREWGIKLTYEERQALPVIRKLLQRKPEAAAMVFEGMARQSAANILLQAQKELADLLKVSQAITQAAGEIAKLEKNDG